MAVDCEKRECPEVQSANITFFHPNSNGKNDVCSDAGVGLAPCPTVWFMFGYWMACTGVVTMRALTL